VLITGCNQNNSTGTGLPPSENPKDYFPMSPGTEWHYKITAGDAEPLSYRTTDWPLNEKVLAYSTRGLIYSAKPGKTYDLVIKVVEAAQEQGPLRLSGGVKLEAVKDDLNIFDGNDCTGIFWAPYGNDGNGRYMVDQVTTYSPDSAGSPTGSWGGWGQKDGYSLRVIFFADKPGTEIGLAEDPDSLMFEGTDSSLPECKDYVCLKFVRYVKESDTTGEKSSLDKAFTETSWFAKNKGMVRLEQKIDGQTSMTWTLEKFVT
jgi:hypothetical protein